MRTPQIPSHLPFTLTASLADPCPFHEQELRESSKQLFAEAFDVKVVVDVLASCLDARRDCILRLLPLSLGR